MTAVVAPFDVSPYVARIAALCPAVLFAGRAADHLAAINQGPRVTPSAYVLEPVYQAQGNANFSGSTIDQLLHFQIGVLTCVRNMADATGAAASADAFVARSQVFAALVGFKPDADGFTTRAGSGKLLSYRDGVFYYLDTFNIEFHIRNN